MGEVKTLSGYLTELTEQVKEMQLAQLIMLYSIAKYHEKYRLTEIIWQELKRREVPHEGILKFDDQFKETYLNILTCEGL